MIFFFPFLPRAQSRGKESNGREGLLLLQRTRLFFEGVHLILYNIRADHADQFASLIFVFFFWDLADWQLATSDRANRA